MKRIIYFIFMCTTLAGCLSSCEGNVTDTGKDYSFMFAENPVMVSGAGGEYDVTIITDTGYTPVSLDNWITDVTKVYDESVSFKVTANSSDTTRDGKIAFYIDGCDDIKELIVRQGASIGGLKLSVTSHTFEVSGGEKEITISAPVGWEVTDCPDWIVATKKNAASLILTAQTNFSGKIQSGAVTIATSTETASITVSQEHDNSIFCNASTPMGRRFVYNTGGLVTSVATDNSYSLAEGVNVLEIKYTGKISGSVLPYYVYIFEVDLTKDVTILASCKDDDATNIKKTDEETTGVQTTRGQLSAMQSTRSAKTVYGGINGDFFYGEGSTSDRGSLLQGVMHKDGVCLKETFDGGNVCTVFAMTKDGKARIMTQSVYKNNQSEIQEAIGGRQEVLTSGTVTTVKNNKYDPRTAVGVSADRNKVILVVFDGRQSNHSNGADYYELGTILKAMGAYNGINLDGGGSSTFVVRDNNAFTVKNKPSGGTEREVVNGLAIISK